MKRELKAAQALAAQYKRELDAMFELKKSKSNVVIKATKGAGSEATAIVLLSDFHYEEIVKPSAVFNRNRYNLDIAYSRATQCFTKIARLIKKEQQDVVIKDCIVGLLGDFITSRIHEENLENCALRPIEALIQVRAVLDAGIRYLLANTDVNFTFVCCAGNHGRITKRVHHSTEQGNSLEWMLYDMLYSTFRTNPRVKFIVNEGYHTYVTVYNRVLRFHHGHNVQYGGGVGGLTIPLNKAIAQWNTVNRADIDFIGHWHQYMVHNNFVVNGSLIGYNAYSLAIKASFEKPKQAFVLLDKIRGLTVAMPIMFDE